MLFFLFKPSYFTEPTSLKKRVHEKKTKARKILKDEIISLIKYEMFRCFKLNSDEKKMFKLKRKTLQFEALRDINLLINMKI